MPAPMHPFSNMRQLTAMRQLATECALTARLHAFAPLRLRLRAYAPVRLRARVPARLRALARRARRALAPSLMPYMHSIFNMMQEIYCIAL